MHSGLREVGLELREVGLKLREVDMELREVDLELREIKELREVLTLQSHRTSPPSLPLF